MRYERFSLQFRYKNNTERFASPELWIESNQITCILSWIMWYLLPCSTIIPTHFLINYVSVPQLITRCVLSLCIFFYDSIQLVSYGHTEFILLIRVSTISIDIPVSATTFHVPKRILLPWTNSFTHNFSQKSRTLCLFFTTSRCQCSGSCSFNSVLKP